MPRFLRRRVYAPTRYLLRDDFGVDVASADVSGSFAIPGPGQRYAQSRSGQPVISGGWAELGPWDTSDGTPGIWLPNSATVGLTPFAGITVFARIKGDGVNPIYGNGGWDVDRGSHISSFGVQIVNNAVNNTFDSVASDEIIDIAVVANGSGAVCYRFIKSTTAFPHWTFLDANIAQTYTALWAVTCKDSNAYVGTHYCKFLRVPANRLVFPPLVSDTFTTTFGTTIEGIAWTNRAGTWTISSGRAKAATLTSGLALATVPCGTSNLRLRMGAVFKGAGAIYGYVGLVLRYKDLNNYVRVTIGHDGTEEVVECTEYVAGTPTQLFKVGAPAYGFSSGQALEAVLNNSTLQAFYSNSPIVGATATLNLVGVATDEVGILSTVTSTSDLLDNFSVRARGNEGQYDWLDQYVV